MITSELKPPFDGFAPEVWLLGLGENSAKLAGSMGAGYVFGHFISPREERTPFNHTVKAFGLPFL